MINITDRGILEKGVTDSPPASILQACDIDEKAVINKNIGNPTTPIDLLQNFLTFLGQEKAFTPVLVEDCPWCIAREILSREGKPPLEITGTFVPVSVNEAEKASGRQATSTGGDNPQLRVNLPQAGGRTRDKVAETIGLGSGRPRKLDHGGPVLTWNQFCLDAKPSGRPKGGTNVPPFTWNS